MMPLSCATSSASAICRAIDSARSSGRAASFACELDRVRQRVGKRLSFDELENQEANAVRFLEAVDRTDVGMVQRREHPRLALEPREPIGVARERTGQDLDRDVARELGVVRLIHLAHAARAQQRVQLIAAKGRTGHRREDDIGDCIR